jgi:CO dehydrogenase maturation factor
MKDLMEERLGALEGFFKINPHVDDIPERFSVEHSGVRLLVMGGVRQGGAGCACPENTILRSLLQHLMLARDEWVIVDCEAGLEHLGRATAQGVDALLIVIEPDRVGVETARRIRKLAAESPAAREAARSGTPIQDSELTAQVRAIMQTLQAG